MRTLDINRDNKRVLETLGTQDQAILDCSCRNASLRTGGQDAVEQHNRSARFKLIAIDPSVDYDEVAWQLAALLSAQVRPGSDLTRRHVRQGGPLQIL
jgi:hypothetical protein